MAYNVSNNFRKTIYSGSAEHDIELTIGEQSFDFTQVEKVIISDSVVDKTSQVFYLGTFVSKQVEIVFRNANDIDLTGRVDLTIKTKVGNTWESVHIGYFNIDTSPETYYKEAKITCLDDGIKFKPNVSSSFYDTYYTVDGTGNKTITLENLLKGLCKEYLGDNMLGTYPDVNRNVIVASFDNTVSGKQYISWIAELMGSNAKIGRDGKLYLVPIKNASTVTIDALSGKSFKKDKAYRISKIRFDNGIVLPSEHGNEDYNTLNIRSSNMLISGDDNVRNTIVLNVYNAVKDLEIWTIQAEDYGDISLDSFDIVTYEIPEDEKEYTTFYSYTITYQRSIMAKINTQIPSKQVEKTTNVIKDDTPTQIRNIKTEMNQIENSVKTVITNTQQINGDLQTLRSTSDSNYKEVMNKFSTVASQNDLNTLQTKMTQMSTDYYTKQEANAIISGKDPDGNAVSYFRTETAIFDVNGLTIDSDSNTEDNITKSNLNEKGLSVVEKNTGDKLLYVGLDDTTKETIVYSKNMRVNKYFEMGSNTRFEDFTDEEGNFGTGCFWIGG